MPLVSVIIPAFNMGVVVGDAIRSALSQTHLDTEVLVIDDGSTDDTREVVAAFGDAVRYAYQQNAGANAARNLGVGLASGEYLAFLDADDVWMPSKLTKQLAAAAVEPEVFVVGCGYSVQSVDGKTIHDTIVRQSFRSHGSLRRALHICQLIPGSSSGVMIHRRCFNEVGLFDPSLTIGEDWDMWLRLVERFNARFVEEVLVVIRLNDLKPGYRTLANEERFVRQVIERRIPRQAQHRALALLYARLARAYLSAGRPQEALSRFVQSIKLRPFGIFPPDPFNRYRFPRVPRYYLLMKSLIKVRTETAVE